MQSPDLGLVVAEREIEGVQRARFPGAELWSEAGPPGGEELRRLVADGLEKGFLTSDEIAAALEGVELTREESEDFLLLPGRALDRPARGRAARAAGARATSARRGRRERGAETGPERRAGSIIRLGHRHCGRRSLDSLGLFMREIGRVPLLTAEHEVTLAKRVEHGDMAAKTQMVEANLRLPDREHHAQDARVATGSAAPEGQLLNPARVPSSGRFRDKLGARRRDQCVRAAYLPSNLASAPGGPLFRHLYERETPARRVP
jgi:Sigma-70 factor, region 1.2/Sigma-70 factor, region 1.1